MEFRIKDNVITIDKKVLIGVGAVILIVILLLVFKPGKQDNMLVCEKSLEIDSASINRNIKFYFKKDHLYKMETYYKNKPTADFQDMLQKIYDNYKGQNEELKNGGGYEYNVVLGPDYVETTETIDIETIPDSTKIAIGFNSNWLYKDVKANLEENDFSCK